MLKEVQPEDIKDETDRFVHLFTEERDSDVVKRIRLKKGKMPFYLVSFIEHKSEVDYNVVMQIFRYMAFIWEDYEYLEKVTTGTPEYLLGIISQIIEILLSRLNVPPEEAAEFVGQVKERKMGELFANFKGYDVQAVRRKVREEDIEKLIKVNKKHGCSRKETEEDLTEQYDMTEDEAAGKVALYW